MSIMAGIIKNTASQGFGKLGTIALSLLTTALLTRFLGASGYGTYTFITAFVLLFGTVSDWGTNLIAVREASREQKRQPVIFGNVIFLRLLLALVALALLNLVIRARGEWRDLVYPTTIASFVLVALSLKTSINIVFQTLLRLEKTAIVELFSSAFFLLFVLVSFSFNLDLAGVMLGWVGATLFAGLLGFVLAKRETPFVWAVDAKILERIVWEALPAGALLLVFNIYNRVDVLILEHFKGDLAVGIYGLAYKIHDNLVLGSAFLMNAVFPLLSESFNTDKERLKRYLQKTLDLLLVGAVAVAAVTQLAAPVLIKLLGGEDFSESTGVLRILAFATFIAYFNHLTGYSLIAIGRQKISLLIALGALVFNVLANWVFIPLFSYTAAAIITVATEGLVLLLSAIVVVRITGVRPKLLSFPKTWLALLKRKGEDVEDLL